MDNQFIGGGITFPIEVNSKGSVDVMSNNVLLRSSIKNILYWPTSQRFFNEQFGSRIFDVLEEPNDNIGKALVRTFIFEALNRWEKRILVKDTRVLNSDHQVINIEITYEIRSTRTEETMVFPFYKEIIY